MNSSFDIIFLCEAKFLRSMGNIFLMRKTINKHQHAALIISVQEAKSNKIGHPIILVFLQYFSQLFPHFVFHKVHVGVKNLDRILLPYIQYRYSIFIQYSKFIFIKRVLVSQSTVYSTFFAKFMLESKTLTVSYCLRYNTGIQYSYSIHYSKFKFIKRVCISFIVYSLGGVKGAILYYRAPSIV